MLGSCGWFCLFCFSHVLLDVCNNGFNIRFIGGTFHNEIILHEPAVRGKRSRIDGVVSSITGGGAVELFFEGPAEIFGIGVADLIGNGFDGVGGGDESMTRFTHAVADEKLMRRQAGPLPKFGVKVRGADVGFVSQILDAEILCMMKFDVFHDVLDSRWNVQGGGFLMKAFEAIAKLAPHHIPQNRDIHFRVMEAVENFVTEGISVSCVFPIEAFGPGGNL